MEGIRASARRALTDDECLKKLIKILFRVKSDTFLINEINAELSREKLGKKVNNHKLNTLAEYFGVALPTHSARDDVMTTYEVYKKLNSIK